MLIDYFYSDPHFRHRRIVELASRPFSDLEHMQAALISNYNNLVGQDQTVLWLGDCYTTPEIVSQLNGHKILILGNHDKSAGSMAKMGFDLVMDTGTMHIGERSCLISHYPYWGSTRDDGEPDLRYPERRPTRVKGQVLIHGHTHSKKRRNGNMIHVGVDAWDYRPVSFVEVESLVDEV